MQAKIQKIGDQFGLMLPGELLRSCGFGTEATMTVQNDTLVVTPGPRRPRAGWAEALQAIPTEQLDRDFEELCAFREMGEEWAAKDWRWPEAPENEKI